MPLRWEVASGVGYGAIGGAASAAFAPDFKNLIDPSGAALDEGQRAALGAFGTLLGGSLAGLAGQDEHAGASAAQNEALNNAGDHNADGIVGMLNKGLFAASPTMWTATQLLLAKLDKLKVHVSVDTGHGADSNASQLDPFDGQDGSSGGPTAGGSAIATTVSRVLAGVASEFEFGFPLLPTSSAPIPKVTFTLSSGDTSSDSSPSAANASGETARTSRPSGFRKQTVSDAWANAADGSAPDTKACPTCGKDVTVAPGQGRRDWDVDHQPPWSQRDLSGMTRQQILDEYNRGTRLECPSCNRSRGGKPAGQ